MTEIRKAKQSLALEGFGNFILQFNFLLEFGANRL